MTSEQYKRAYNEIIRPSLIESLPNDMLHLIPLSYDIEMEKKKTSGGQFTFRGLLISRNYINNFLAGITAECKKISSHDNMFFHVHGKNLKTIFRSSIADPLQILSTKYDFIDWENICYPLGNEKV